MVGVFVHRRRTDELMSAGGGGVSRRKQPLKKPHQPLLASFVSSLKIMNVHSQII